MILYAVFGIVVLALLLYILIKKRNHHKDLITNGLIIIAVVGAIFVANYYLTHRDMVVAQSLDYANQNK
jgi:LPXTG-motif cell wall-anchored protein